jgi:hypothetical protein
MQITKLHEDIYEVADFLTKQELKEVFEIIKNISEQDWFSEDTFLNQDQANFWYGKTIDFEGDTIFPVINKKIKDLFESFSMYPDNTCLQRYEPGQSIKYHKDVWNVATPLYVSYGVLLYYNDDYLGGELDYEDLGLVIKPKENSLYIHGGNILHGSRPVLGDKSRYFSTAFVYGTKDKPAKLKKELFN